MYNYWIRMNSVAELLLLLGVTSVLTDVPLQNNSENVEDGAAFARSRREVLQKEIAFSWNEPGKNDVINLTAQYNKLHFEPKSNESIHLWVSFEPRNYDIRDDIEPMLDVINKANSVYPRTIFSVVLNYGRLPLDQESLVLVNHEIKKVSQILKDTPGNKLALVLQVDRVNCENRMELTKNLKLQYVDILRFSIPTRDVLLEKKDDLNMILLPQMGCAYHLLNKVIYLPLMAYHTHMSIKISTDQGLYDYKRNILKPIAPTSLIFFWTEDNGQGKNIGTISGKNDEMNPEWINWLQKPVTFNKHHFGGVISATKRLQPTIFESFDKIIIEISENTLSTRQTLQQIMSELAVHTSLTSYSNWKERVPPQIHFIVTITKNDFELNKKQVDSAIWAAVNGNRLLPGAVQRIAFDWSSCVLSEVCSGYKNNNPKMCSAVSLSKDLKKLQNYTEFALKGMNFDAVSLLVIWDVHDVKSLYRTSTGERCDTEDGFLGLTVDVLKFSLSEEDLLNKGAVKMFTIATAKLNSYVRILAAGNSHIAYSYLQVVGCNNNYSGTSHLTEFALFYEKLSTWAVSINITLYVSAMIENPEECEQKRRASPDMKCTCGWWVVEKSVNKIHQSATRNFLNKKAIAVQHYERKINAQKTNGRKPVSAVSNKLLVCILVPFFLLVALISAGTVVIVMRYRSKYIMTREEVATFLKGRLQQSGRDEERAPEDGPYDTTKYEIALSSFTIDKASCVGSGEFGKVFRGSITRGSESTTSAVKVANTRALGKSHGGRIALMGLLSEIKILAYLGEHDHIVTLLGAFTANLRRGELSVFLEFCDLGSLYNYLRSIQPNQQETMGTDDADASLALMIIASRRNAETPQHHLLNSDVCDELYGYCGQVASGMAFIASKNVVHADLATRNVLLTGEKVAKICDFGLSRRMYSYSEYLKRSQSPLPWRWMPPESLQRLIFNEKSDVWAFGVTLWEICTLGDEPYPGLSYHVNFPAMLERGMRLPVPRYNVKQVYSVMKRCWNIIPAERPSFNELILEL